MGQHTAQASFVGAGTRDPARSAARRIGALALLLTLVMGPLSSCIIVPSAPQTVQADKIEANQVRAHTIYANKIEASEVTGAIHQTGDVKVDDERGDIKAPTVVASVIYADSIKAHTVAADHIYVRKLERR